MNSQFLDELDALLRCHSSDSGSRASEERVIMAISAVVAQTAREIVAELRGTAPSCSPRQGAMIRYRPDWDRSGPRQGAMIRYRPDWERDPRSAAMIRYRPDWDRQADGMNANFSPAEATGRGLLEPILKSLAERLGPAEAAKLVQTTMSNIGLVRQPADAEKGTPDAESNKGSD